LSGRGARSLCLLGRSGVTTAEQRAQIAACEAQGTRVRIATGDVADREMLAALVRDLGSDAPLRGVVHAAGVAGWTDLADLSGDHLAAVLRPKIDGAWALHEATRGATLDFFVCFSSIAAAWGSRGQAHYAAGNAFLDALAHLRHGAGLPAVSIGWGPWLEGGMSSPEAEALLRRVGVRPLSTSTGLAALATLVTSPHPQLIVADIDWPLFRGTYEASGHRRLLERMEGAAPGVPAAAIGETALMQRLGLAAASDRERLLCSAVQSEVARVLGLANGSAPPLEQGLFEMGLDSLMALELRTRLQIQLGRGLPATLVFDCPTINAIARFVMAGPAPTPVPAMAAAPPTQTATAEVDALSDAEAEVLLLRRLESIH
jgi:acyl carrier protein